MTRSNIALAALIVLAIGCSDSTTSVRLNIVAAPGLTLDGLVFTVDGTRHEEAMVDSLQLLVPDSWAGIAQRIEVQGTHEDAVIAVGAVVVTPIAGEEVTANVTLVDASCDLVCEIGSVRCDGDGVVTCELGTDGCPSWSVPAACASPTPFCSNGSCSATCADECISGATMCELDGDVRTCGQTDSDSCLDWSTELCPTNQICAGDRCTEAFTLTVVNKGAAGTVASSPSGIACGASCTATFPAGTEVTLTATPGTGATFTGWSGGGCAGIGTCVVTLNAAIQVTAGFAGIRVGPKADLIVSYAGGTAGTRVGLSTGTGFDPLVLWSTTQDESNFVRFADVNGDGRADLIVSYAGGTAGTRVGLSTGTGFDPLVLWSTTQDESNFVRFADVNGDGRADLIRSYPGGVAGTQVGLSTGTGFDPLMLWSTTQHESTFVRFADVNGDGRADLIYSSSVTAGTEVGLSTGTGFDPLVSWSTTQDESTYIRFADVNGDGRADLIRSYPGGVAGTQVGLSTGTGFDPLVLWSTTQHESTYLQFADVNGDGRADLIVSYSGGDAGTRVGLSNGTGFDPIVLWSTTQADSTYLQFADVDGN